jgi:ATP-dependent protease Clp ATPase subunit
MNKETINMLLATIPEFSDRLDMLTTIEILTSDEKLMAICEEIRNELAEGDALL